jgi:hypothetical protein
MGCSILNQQQHDECKTVPHKPSLPLLLFNGAHALRLLLPPPGLPAVLRAPRCPAPAYSTAGRQIASGNE